MSPTPGDGQPVSQGRHCSRDRADSMGGPGQKKSPGGYPGQTSQGGKWRSGRCVVERGPSLGSDANVVRLQRTVPVARRCDRGLVTIGEQGPTGGSPGNRDRSAVISPRLVVLLRCCRRWYRRRWISLGGAGGSVGTAEAGWHGGGGAAQGATGSARSTATPPSDGPFGQGLAIASTDQGRQRTARTRVRRKPSRLRRRGESGTKSGQGQGATGTAAPLPG